MVGPMTPAAIRALFDNFQRPLLAALEKAFNLPRTNVTVDESGFFAVIVISV